MSLQEELDNIVKLWEEDSVIDELRIESETLNTPKLHSKYLKFLKNLKYRKLGIEIKFNELKQFKFRYWRGELSKEELIKANIPQWQNNKPLKSELESMANADPDLNKLKYQIDLLQIGIESLEIIIKQIQSRDFEISNYIKIRKFNNGEDF